MTSQYAKNKKIKLLFILRTIGFGGTERQVVELCRGINKDKFDITVVLFFHQEGFLLELKDTGVTVEILAQKSTYKVVSIIRLIRLIKRENFDIIQTFLPIANFIGGIAAKICSRAYIIGSLRNANPFSWMDPFCVMDMIALTLFSDFVIVNSEITRKYAIEKYGVSPKKIHIISNGKNFQDYITQENLRLKANIGLNEHSVVVTTIGRVTKQKGHRYLIEAANILINQMDRDLTFLIVGKPEDASRDIMYMIDKFALKNHVKMLGIRKDIPEILDISDIFALPSLWEGLANVLLEAMSAKLPIVATNIEANCEVIENNKTGILVPPKNSTAIADAIAELLGNKNEARKLGEAAYLSVVNNYTVDKLVRNHERFYKQIRERNAAIRNTT